MMVATSSSPLLHRGEASPRALTMRVMAPCGSVTTAPDLAWFIDPVSSQFGSHRLRTWAIHPGAPVVAVNLANENPCLDYHTAMGDALASVLDELIEERGATILFFCSEAREGETCDTAATPRIMARMKHAKWAVLAPNEYFSPRELMSIIGSCQLVISMRYHVCLFSAIQRVPFIAIEHADKVADLCCDLNWPYRVRPPHLDPQELMGQARALLADSQAARRALAGRREVMHARAFQNVIPLEHISLAVSTGMVRAS